MSVEEAQSLIGQWVILKHEGKEVGGILRFVGPNEYFPSWGIQCTIDRTPFTNCDLGGLRKLERP